MAAITNCPEAAITANWPLIFAALEARGAASERSCAAALGTIAVETASTFRPLHEYGTAADWAHYSGGANYAGRGFIQLTHDYNYRAAGDALGENLLGNPDRAMEPTIAAEIFAWYWAGHGIPASADAENWLAVRQAVVGHVANPPGLPRLVQISSALLAA